MLQERTTAGIGVMGDMPWGTHFCCFFETKQDLIETSIPFFQAGLENHEFCLWIVCAPLTEADALRALRESIPEMDRYLAEGGMEIRVHAKPVGPGDRGVARSRVGFLHERLAQALARGYAGMRVAGSPASIQKKDARVFREFERELGESVANRRMIALCQFPLGQSSAEEILDAARTHQFVVCRRQGDWDIIETPEIKLSKAEIAKLNEELERRVEERSQDLEAANRELRQEIARRERVEEDLRQQKELLQTVFDRMPAMLCVVDKNKRITMVNQEWERTLGWKLEEIPNQDVDFITAAFHPDPEEHQRVGDFVEHSNGEWTDFRTRVRDGRTIDTSWATMRLSDGAHVTIGQDITERKKSEREVRQQKELFQTIFDHIPAMLCVVDKNKRITMLNQEWERTLGWKLEEIPNQDVDFITAAFHPDPEERQRVGDFVEHSNGEWTDFRTRVRDGRTIDTSWATIHLSDGANVTIGQDITERKRSEREVRQRKELFQTIFDNIPVMLCFIDQNNRIKMVNPEWERTLGVKLEEIPNQELDFIVAENYPDPEYRQQLVDFANRSNGEWADWKTTLRDGRIIENAWAILHLSDGTIIGIGQNVTERRQAERELRQQKELLQTIFDHIPVMLCFIDENNRIKLVNREWERTLGVTLEEIPNQELDFVVAENYPDPEYRQQLVDFANSSNGEWADWKTTLRDGRVIDTSWAMLHLSDGTTIGIGQDVTERKRAEEALRESEERFRELAENIRDLFWIKTPDLKRAIYYSPRYQAVSGRSREAAYQDHDYQYLLNRIVPEDRERMAEFMARGVEEEFETEFRVVRPDGTVHWICDRGFPIRDSSGQIYRVAGIAQDITERKLAEEALRESEERFRQLAENIREVFWLRSPDLKQLLYVSPMYEKVCGRSCESLYADGPEAGVHPEDRPRVMETLESLAGSEFEIEYRLVTKNGEVRWLRDRGFPIRNAAGEIYRMGGVAEDITDRKEAEERLKAKREQLRALSASLQSAREQEATRIAHQVHDEMGGILTGLRWDLEAFEKTIQEPAGPEHLKAMRDKLTAMLGLTDAAINAVRRIASELRPSILDDLGLREAIEWQAEQFQARTGIECRSECFSASISLGDLQSTAVFRIFQEALTNILRHAQATRVDVAMREEDGNFLLTVTDNGRGIKQSEVLDRKSLGLLGMQERAHLIGGRVDIAGLQGAGTTLHVRVPQTEEAQ